MPQAITAAALAQLRAQHDLVRAEWERIKFDHAWLRAETDLHELKCDAAWLKVLRAWERHQAVLRKYGYNPLQPRDELGRWTEEGHLGSDGRRVQLADDPPGIGHNQGPRLDEQPEIPKQRPAAAKARHDAVKRAAKGFRRAPGLWGIAIQGVEWLREFAPYISAYNDPPRTLAELQSLANEPAAGYEIHHIAEKDAAKNDGYPSGVINAPENLVRISKLKHWEITGWYMTRNEAFFGLSPREYLRGKDWAERQSVGLLALEGFGVLKK